MVKELMNVSVKAARGDVVKVKTDLLAVGVFSDSKQANRQCIDIDKKLGGAIERVRKLGDFKGEEKTSALLYGNDKIGAMRIILIGLGKKNKANADTLRKAAELAAKQAVDLKAKSVALALHYGVGSKIDNELIGRALTEGAYIGSYRYDELKHDGKEGRGKKLSVNIIDTEARAVRAIAKGVSVGTIIGLGQSAARTFVSRPGNLMYPAQLASEAKAIARGVGGLSCTVLDDKQLSQKKMGGIVAVGKGSDKKPRLIILKYTPVGVKAKGPVLGLVGKAVTFDAGGINVKGAEGMFDMKMDMAGGAAVLGAMKAIAELKLPVRVYGIVPSAENKSGASSYRPGDVITTYSGKTVEIQNTDAEGRMLLCDGITYAKKLKCDVIVDVATLTGACMVALGSYKAGLMGNDDKLIKSLQAAADDSGEQLWHLPCGQEYAEEMKSEIADLKNIGSRWGGACTAAAFLREFAGEDVKWAHIDIAGPGIFGGENKSKSGSVGYGVRLLTAYVMGAAKKK